LWIRNIAEPWFRPSSPRQTKKIAVFQIPVIERAIETAALILGSDRSRDYCLEMICVDFLAGANLDHGDPEMLLFSVTRFFKFGSARQSVRKCILCGFLESDEFGLGGRQALRFQQQVIEVAVTPTTAQQRFDVSIDGFHYPQPYFSFAVVKNSLQMFE